MMKTKAIAAVMIHVPDCKEGIAWYEKAFPEARRVNYPEFDFECLELNGIQIEIVNADEKIGVGTMGLAVDWEVESFDNALKHLISLGATLYRGPAKLEYGRRMCKLKDPFSESYWFEGKIIILIN